MKRILSTAIALFMLGTLALAQQKEDQRTLTTKIADLLAQMPAKNEKELNAAMEEIAAMGEKALIEMAGMLFAPGEGDNSLLEYAIGGFSFYVNQPGKEDWRAMSVDAYCQVLDKIENNENKAFFIKQLQLVGKTDAVSCLEGYLDNEYLCGHAARALVSIDAPDAKSALLRALQGAQGFCQLSLVEALGDNHYAEAAASIAPLAASENTKLRKVALYALAKIADPSSEGILAEAAKSASFTYDEANATSSYLLYAERLIEEGKQQQAEKIAESLLQAATTDIQVHTRTAALQLLAAIRGEKSTSLLIKATEYKDREFRAAALKFAADYLTPTTIDLWLKQFKRADAAVQAEIIAMLGDNDAKAALPAVVKALKSRDDQVKLSAIEATGKLGGNDAVDDLLNVVKKGDKQEIAAVKEALRIMEADNIADQVAAVLADVEPEAQIALVFVLGARAAHEKINEVFLLTDSENSAVRMAALAAMAQMVTKENSPQLFSMLNETTEPEEQEAVQNAIIAALQDIESQAEQAELVLGKMEEVQEGKKVLYFKVLASIGGENALEAVIEAFHKGDATTKKAAVNALANWADVGAANTLYTIGQDPSNNEYLDEALEGYVHAINRSDYPDAQKLLMLRKAMEVAKTAQQKQSILQTVNDNNTFPALVFAGKYLKDPALQQAAAHAVMNIALSNSQFYGDVVRDLLSQTLEALDGQDSEYLKNAIHKHLTDMPKGGGFVSLFNGKDLSGWNGLVANPIDRSKMDAEKLAEAQQKADEEMRKGWRAEDGELIFTGEGNNIVTDKKYGDFEMFADWKITEDGDAGVYLRGTPQVQIWETSRVEVGAQVGSGGLYNNQKHASKPLKVADNPVGEWNTFHILMEGDRVTVYLNGTLVVDNVILENYWDRSLPIFPEEQIELQAHGTHVAYRDIYIREIPRPEPFELSAEEKKQGFEVLFDGTNMHHWIGNKQDYVIDNGSILIDPKGGGRGNLYTKEEYSDFIFRFEYQLTPGANNGLGIRAPMEGDVAYTGMEVQILDNSADIYKNLKEYQYHGSVYGVLAAERGYLKPVGEWNYEEVIVDGPKIKVILNGNVILDGDISEARENGTLDGLEHPGLNRDKGHIGFLGHGSEVRFRNIRIKELSKK